MVLRLGQTVGPLLMGWVLGLGGMDAVLYGGARAGVLVGVAAWLKGEAGKQGSREARKRGMRADEGR